jgi:hypothetical protein
MARPTRNDVDYFPFICKEGKGMFVIEEKYGNNGFATWIKILRSLATTNFHYLNLSDPSEKMFLSAKCKVSQSVLESIIDDLINLGEFDRDLWVDFSILYSEKFIEGIKDAYSKRNNNPLTKDELLSHLLSLGMNKPSKSIPKPSNTTLKGVDNPQSKVKHSIVKEKKEKEIKKEEFKSRNYKPVFDKLFVKIKGRAYQGWITEVYEQRKVDNGNCEKTITEYMEKTLKQSLYEFCYSSKIYGLEFFNETACINYFKMASKGYICDVDTWRKLLKAAKSRAEDQVANSY